MHSAVVTRATVRLAVFGLGVVLWPATARAEIVRLTTGATLSVKTATMVGDNIVLVLRSGGEMTAPKSLVAEITPDEVLHAEAANTFLLPSYEPPKMPATIEDMVDTIADQFGVPTNLAHALVRVESNYQANAVSPKGAMGLMQLMPAMAKYYAVSDPFDPEQNLTAGLQHLKTLLDRFPNDTATALAAYNAGEPAVAKYGKIPPYKETQDYVRRILALAKSAR